MGSFPASTIYVKKKIAACQAVGITSKFLNLSETISSHELLKEIENLNKDTKVDGILVQSPLPSHISTKDIYEAIDPAKDVDGFHPINMGKLLIGDTTGFIPCTPLGIQTLLIKSRVAISGKHVVILGRSNIVGKPLAALLMQNNYDANATVTILHSHSENLKAICKTADILVAAIGNPSSSLKIW